MKANQSSRLVVIFTVLTFLLTWAVILAWEQVFRKPFYGWVETRFPAENRWNIEQRVEHFFISASVDIIVVTLLLRLVGREQRRLRASEARYRSLFEHAHDGIMVTAFPEHRLVEVNQKMEELLGYPPAQLIGREIQDLICAEKKGCRVETFLKQMGGGGFGQGEMMMWTATGHRLPVSVSYSTPHLEQGRLAILVVRDLTERRRSESKFRGLLESSPDAVLLTNSKGVITSVNHQTEIMFGISRNELLGEPVEVLMPERFRDRHKAYRAQYFKEPVIRPMGRGVSLVGQRRDGAEFPVEISLTPMLTEDGLMIVSVIHDISERKRAAEELLQMQAQMAHNEKIAALGRVAAQVAHEVKNPLAGLCLYSRQLQKKAAGQLRHSEAELLTKIIHTIDHLSNTVERVLDFARPVKLVRRMVDLNHIVKDALHLLEPQIEARQIRCRVELANGDMVGRFDDASLRLALINLLLNALQAMPDSGRLTVSTGRCDCEHAIPTYRVAISDTGCGMTSQQIQWVFEPFHTSKNHGLGLGLPYAKKIIERHGGSLKVESEPGEGTCIRIMLPVREGE